MSSNVNNFRPTPISKGVGGDRRRIELAAKRCRSVLSSTLAQDPRCIKMGMAVTLSIVRDEDSKKFNIIIPADLNLPDFDAMDAAMIKFRPFTLKQENIYWERVLESLRRGTEDKKLRENIDQLQWFFQNVPFKRFQIMAANIETGEDILPPGVTNAVVGTRYLYSEVAHADDDEALLGNIDKLGQTLSYACLVGDWIALAAVLESVIKNVYPELCPELTSWAGGPTSINIRQFGEQKRRS